MISTKTSNNNIKLVPAYEYDYDIYKNFVTFTEATVTVSSFQISKNILLLDFGLLMLYLYVLWGKAT